MKPRSSNKHSLRGPGQRPGRPGRREGCEGVIIGGHRVSVRHHEAVIVLMRRLLPVQAPTEPSPNELVFWGRFVARGFRVFQSGPVLSGTPIKVACLPVGLGKTSAALSISCFGKTQENMTRNFAPCTFHEGRLGRIAAASPTVAPSGNRRPSKCSACGGGIAAQEKWVSAVASGAGPDRQRGSILQHHSGPWASATTVNSRRSGVRSCRAAVRVGAKCGTSEGGP